MPEITFKITKAEMKQMEETANQILTDLGYDPDVVRYEQNLKIVQDNLATIMKRKETKKNEATTN